MQKIVLAAVLIVVIAGASVAGYYIWSTTTFKEEERTLRVARLGVPEPTDMNWLYAKDIAIDQYDIDVQFQYFEDVTLGLASLMGGSVDINADTINRQIGAIARGADIKIFMVLMKASDYVLVGGEGITKLEDLAGKTIGVEGIPGGTSYMIARYLMENAGLDPEIAQWTVVGFSGARVAALASGEIDAAAFQVWRYNALIEGGISANILAEHGKGVPKWITLVYAAKTDFIAENHDLLVDFAVAQLKANRDINKNFAAYDNLLEEYLVEPVTGMSNEDYWEFLVDVGMWPEDGGMKQEDFDFMMDVMVAGGDIESELQYDEVADPSIVEEALSKLGS